MSDTLSQIRREVSMPLTVRMLSRQLEDMRLFLRNFILIALAGFSLAACASQQSVQDNNHYDTKIPMDSVVYVMIPEDGRYGQKVYAESGFMTAQKISAAFAIHIQHSELGKKFENQAAAFSAANKTGAQYLIEPRILHWEDRATEWSALPDRIEVLISVYDTESHELVDKATISGKSSLWTLGGDHPQDLLEKPVREYVSALLGS